MFGFDDAALATAAVGGLGFIGQQMTNSAQAEAADKQMEFQQNNSNTAYQRQVADLQAAGLNPMLAYIKGGGASTPTGAMPTYTSPVTGAVQAVSSAQVPSQIRKTGSETNKIGAETTKIGVETKLTEAQINQVDASVDKIEQETRNLKTDNQRINALIVNLEQQRQNMIKENWNLTDQGNVLRATVEKLQAEVPFFASKTLLNYAQKLLTDAEAKLKNFDVTSAERADNFGRDAQQYRILLDVAKAILGRR